MLTACCLAHVLLAFVPAADDAALLERMEQQGIGAVGVTSPTVGGYDPRQMFLDIGQGARVSTRVYDDEIPSLRLLPNGRIAGWQDAVARAEDAPGDIVPGLLGETVRRAGGRTAYVGLEGLSHDEAASVADRSGSDRHGGPRAARAGSARGSTARSRATSWWPPGCRSAAASSCSTSSAPTRSRSSCARRAPGRSCCCPPPPRSARAC